MVRQKLAGEARRQKDPIKWRGDGTLRIEAFSDSVFAFALTLLIVSLEVPKTFAQLKDIFAGFIAFGVSFVLLFQVWYYQNLFFRRYGLQDVKTIVLNGALLFMVLFYVYPLKFLFAFLNPGSGYFSSIKPEEVPQLMLMYGLGYCAIFILFTLMYRHAAKSAHVLNLTEKELFETRTHVYRFISFVGVGIFVTTCAFIVPYKWAGVTGALYALVGPAISIVSSKRDALAHKKFGR